MYSDEGCKAEEPYEPELMEDEQELTELRPPESVILPAYNHSACLVPWHTSGFQ